MLVRRAYGPWKKNIFYGLNDYTLEFDSYEHCIYVKPNHVQFYSSFHKYFGLLDWIHYDVFGSIKVISIYKYLYHVSFVDNYSRRTWVYFLRTKSKVELIGILRFQGLIIVVSFSLQSLISFVRRIALKDIR